LLYSN